MFVKIYICSKIYILVKGMGMGMDMPMPMPMPMPITHTYRSQSRVPTKNEIFTQCNIVLIIAHNKHKYQPNEKIRIYSQWKNNVCTTPLQKENRFIL